MKLIILAILQISLLSIQALADGDYCVSHTDREETTVSCPSNDDLIDFKVDHKFGFRITFAAGEALEEIKNEAIAEVEDLLFRNGYISRGRFGNYTLFQRKVGNPSEQTNTILVKGSLKYSFIKEGGWTLDAHNQDAGERNNFIERVVSMENLSLETILSMPSYNRYGGAEVVIYKVDR